MVPDGDLVAADADGRLTFKGRLKRFIKLGGEMVSLPAIEAVLQRHFGEADDGPVIAVEAIGDPEHPDIVLFTRRPADRAEVNALIKDAGLSAAALRPAGHRRGVDPGARHRQDRLPGAEGPLLGARTPERQRSARAGSAAGPGEVSKNTARAAASGYARCVGRAATRAMNVAARVPRDERPDAAAESRAESRRRRGARGAGPRARGRTVSGTWLPSQSSAACCDRRPARRNGRGRRRAARRPRRARWSGSPARTDRSASSAGRAPNSASPDGRAMASRMASTAPVGPPPPPPAWAPAGRSRPARSPAPAPPRGTRGCRSPAPRRSFPPARR